MPDTQNSIYSEYEKASQTISRETGYVEWSIDNLVKILKESKEGSPEFDKTLKGLIELENTPIPETVYCYTDEEGNDNYTTLGGGHYYIKELDPYRNKIRHI